MYDYPSWPGKRSARVYYSYMYTCNCVIMHVAMVKIAHTCDLIYIYRCLHCTACNKQLYSRLSPAFLLSRMTVLCIYILCIYVLNEEWPWAKIYVGAMGMLWASGHLMVM